MRIEGTIAVTAAVSDQMLTVDAAVSSQARDRVNQDVERQQALASPNPVAIATEQRAVGPKLLSSAVEAIERFLEEMDDGSVALRIKLDGKRLVVRVVDRKTGKVVRELPASTFLQLLAAQDKRIAGLFVDEHQ